ncbi:MAG TPA: ABC transporter permease [Candidatus Udaeobacter sp.]|jgi:putative ABC transport system permease protein|nr:ABC transporter permease [Candidatus Udaeobacter sp.]
MQNIWQDVRYGARMLWKHRLATLVCAVALALGIGANTAMFSVAEAFLLHSVPFENADRIVAMVNVRPQQNIDRNPVAPATYLDWQTQAKSFEQLGAYEWHEVNLTGNREPEKVQAFDVTTNFFGLLGVQPKMGRTFLPEEEQPGKDQEMILSYGLWERRYGSDPNILNKIVKVDGKSFIVVGVMGKGFDFPMPAEAWVPLALDVKQRSERASRYIWVLGKLRPDTSIKRAAAEMGAIAQRETDAYPDSYKGWQLRVMPVREFANSDLTRQYTLLLMGAVGFVLLIACADVANVQFARVSGRQRELAVRTAMGASRARIVCQLLTESILLALLGSVAGLLFAQWDIALILAHMPADVAKYVAGWKTISLDSGAFLFTLAIALFSGILSGIAPALLTSRRNVSETLKESGRGSSAGRARHRLRNVLVVAEISLSLVLLVGAGLLVKNFTSLISVNERYRPESLLTLNLSLPQLQYKAQTGRVSFHEQVLQRLSTIPNVQSAATVTHVPYSDGGGVGTRVFSIEGRPATDRGEMRSAIVQTISPNYFGLMQITQREGRELADSDAEGTLPVAVISRSLARRYFPSENSLGRKLKIGQVDDSSPWLTIIGIVDDVHYSWIEKDEVPTIYRSYRQSPPFYASLVLRTGRDPLSLVPAVRGQIATVDPDLPLFNIEPLDKVISDSIVGIAYVAVMMGVLGIIALVLASVGVYGVMSHAVSERTNEIGIRMAMGATANDIQRLVLGRGALLTLVGMAIGLPVAFALANALSSLLFGVKVTDPVAFIVIPLVLAGVSTLASYIPARRALRVDPIVALRYE